MLMNKDECANFTLPQLIAKRIELHGRDKVAIREKQFGIWEEWSWQEYYDTVKAMALGLVSLGFQKGGVVAILPENCFKWMAAQMAVQSLGGVPVCLYETSVSREVEYVLDLTKAIFVIAQDQEQVDKIIEIRSKIPQVRNVIFIESKGMRGYVKDHWFLHIEELLSMGKEFENEEPGLFEKILWEGKPEDICQLTMTSGTTKLPKFAMLTHMNFIKMILGIVGVDPIEEGDDYLSFISPAWIGEQWISALAQITGCVINFPDEMETAMQDLREIGPHVFFGPPRFWEGICSRIKVDIQDATWLKQLLFNSFLKVGYRVAERRFRKEVIPISLKILYSLASAVMFRPLKDRLGFLRLRRAYTGGAALGPDMFRFFHAMGVNIKQVYGQTETCGLCTIHVDGDVKFETVGKSVPETEIRIGESGEIQVKSPSLLKGYYKMPEETEKALMDGWLCTGDAGYFDEDEHLVVIDRISDVMNLESGEMFSPQFIENKLKFSSFINNAVVFGDGLPYVAAFINIDMEVVGKWAEKRKLAYNTYMDLSQKKEVCELVQKEVVFVNTQLTEAIRIKKFVSFYKELDADDEEITRTGKVRRDFVGNKYGDLRDALYSEKGFVEAKARIQYQDGKVAEVETKLVVYAMEG